ncbi:MAG TPA: DUF6297 family protein [Longimicrobiales bacterium]|nr:DUF6297 family protein [Longimicrobiales bacterium]
MLTHLYTLLWITLIYGGAFASEVSRISAAPAAGTVPVERQWIAAAVLLACAGLGWMSLRALGPLLVTPAEQVWGLSSPIDRLEWLLPRFSLLLAGGTLAGAAAAGLAVFLATAGGSLALAAVGGGCLGAAFIAGGVAAQNTAGSKWPDVAGTLLLAAGVLAAAVMVAAHFGGWRLPRAGTIPGVILLPIFLAVAAGAVTLGARSLRRVDRIALGAGTDLAGALVTATVSLDPSLLTRMIEYRRWRRIGRVPTGRLRPAPPGIPGRTWALLQADVRRSGRRPLALSAWAGLALAQYALFVVAPSLAGMARLAGTYLAAGAFTAGLRTISHSDGLRRALGGSDRALRMIHLAIPAAAAALWWILTRPAGGPSTGPMEILLLSGVVAAVYRAATRPPIDYSAPVVETPFGLLPLGLVLQLVRGPDVLGGVLVLQILWNR